MSNEPALKKPKVDWGLSDPSEPLTRKDVVAFQKEALFRAINKHRCREESLEKQLEAGKEHSASVRDQYAVVCATLIGLARKLLTFVGQDSEAHKLCQRMLEGSEAVIAQSSAEFIQLLEKHLSTEEQNADKDASITQQIHKLESTKVELSTHNKQLQKEISAIREHYQTLIRRYDREESDTIKRVFKTQETADGAPNQESAEVTTGRNHASATDTNVMKEEKVEKEEKEDTVPRMDHQLQVDDLSNQIELLRGTLKDLEAWKVKSESELVRLRTELASNSRQGIEPQYSPSSDREALQRKIQVLTKENAEITQANDSYLSKFQQMIQDKEIFTSKLSTEFQTAQDALKKHNAMLEKDLVRIRATRDELSSKLAILESQKPKSELLDDLQKVLDLQKERIDKMGMDPKEMTNDAVLKELRDLERAFKEITQYAHKKYSDHISQESVIAKLTVEKTKADQKYFTAMRSKDSILIENKNLSKNLHKSNELIAQLKEIERTLQNKIESLNKQIHLSQNNEKRLLESNKALSNKTMELTSDLSKLKKAADNQLSQKTKYIEEKVHLESQVHSLQTDNNALKLQVSQAENRAKKLHKSLVSNGGDNGVIAEELDNFRTIVYCSLCSKNWKNTAIKNCGHVFCEECCKERLAARMRKCPTCNKPFGSADLLVVHL